MNRSTCLVFSGILVSSTLLSMPYYALELHGGSRIYANDPPVRRGRLILFHRYPDGAYMSLAAAEVERVVEAEEPPRQSGKLMPGDTVFIGPALEGPGHQPQKPAARPDMSYGTDSGYGGYAGLGWGGYLPPPQPPGPPPPFVPSRIGPNGFPIIAPPGSPGSIPPATGPNGFPILSPQPPLVSPRR
jgi:hypothetical protein